MESFDEIKHYLRHFARERDWEKFHNPKNLATALSVEVAELNEHFQWLTPEQAANLEPDSLAKVADEIADVQLYLIRLADVLGLDIVAAIQQKAIKNEAKYPPEKVRGSAKKYTEYE